MQSEHVRETSVVQDLIVEESSLMEVLQSREAAVDMHTLLKVPTEQAVVATFGNANDVIATGISSCILVIWMQKPEIVCFPWVSGHGQVSLVVWKPCTMLHFEGAL
jgi:hypothetical protein